ncbi:importin [Nucleospora cyclopteri]
MHQELRQFFSDTVNSNTNVRHKAEEELKKIECRPDVLKLILNNLIKDPDLMVKQASSIFLANKIAEHYTKDEMSSFISELEENILNYMVLSTDNSEKMLYEKVLITVFDKADTPKIERIITQASHFIKTNEVEKVTTGIKAYETVFKSNAMRMCLLPIFNVMFVMNGESFNVKFQEAIRAKQFGLAKSFMKVVARTYKTYNLPPMMLTVSVFQIYFRLALNIVTMEKQEDEGFIKLKKWALFFLYSSTNKGIKNYFKSEELCNFIREEQTIKVLVNAFMTVVSEYKVKKIAHEKYLIHTSSFFEVVASSKYTKSVLEGSVDQIMFNFVIPAYTFNDELETVFELDPENYLGERYNFVMDKTRGAISSLFSSIVNQNRNLEGHLMNFLVQNLYSNSVDPKVKYGILGLLAEVQKSMTRVLGEDNFCKFIEGFIRPTLLSGNLFMTSQCFYFMSLSEDVKMKPEQMVDLMQIVFKFSNHENAALQVESCLSMAFFFYAESLRSHLKSIMPGLLDRILKYNKQYLLESLNSLMDLIISNFSDFITDYAPVFTTTIMQNIENLWEDKENADKLVSISNYLQSIDRLVVASSEQPSIVKDIYNLTVGIIYKIFKENELELFQEGLDLMNTFLYTLEEVDGKGYEIFKAVVSVDKDELILYPDELADFMDNFVSFGGEKMINQEVLVIYFNIFKMFFCGEEDLYDEDLYAACGTINSLLMYAGPQTVRTSPQFVPSVVQAILSKYEAVEELGTSPVIHVLEVLMNCFTVQPQETLAVLGTSQNFIFDKICFYSVSFKRVVDKKIFIVFIATLFKLNLTVDIGKFNTAFINVFTTLPEAIRKRNVLMDEEDEDEEDEDEEYDDLYEDIYSANPLDKLDVYEYVRNMLTNLHENSIGQLAIKSMKPEQIEAIKTILGRPQEKQKL